MKLDELPKKNIYEVPAGYFDKLPQVIMTRVQEESRERNSVWAFLNQAFWLRSALASLVLIIGIFFVFKSTDKLPQVIMTRVQEESRERNSVWAFLNQAFWLRSALATLVLIIGIFFVFKSTDNNNNLTQNKPAELIAQVSKNEAMDYLLNNEQLHSTDLAYLSQTEQDLTFEFIQASEEEIWHEVELADLNDITSN